MTDNNELNIASCEERISVLRREQLALECGDDFLFTNRNGNYPKYESIGRELTALRVRLETLKGPDTVRNEKLMRHPLSEWFNFCNDNQIKSYCQGMKFYMDQLRQVRGRCKSHIRAIRNARKNNEDFMERITTYSLKSDFEYYCRLVKQCRGYRAMKVVGA